MILGQPRNISTKLFENRPDTFGEDFFRFHHRHLKLNSPPLSGHVFRPINMALMDLINGHPRNISAKLFENWPGTFEKEIFKFPL